MKSIIKEKHTNFIMETMVNGNIGFLNQVYGIHQLKEFGTVSCVFLFAWLIFSSHKKISMNHFMQKSVQQVWVGTKFQQRFTKNNPTVFEHSNFRKLTDPRTSKNKDISMLS